MDGDAIQFTKPDFLHHLCHHLPIEWARRCCRDVVTVVDRSQVADEGTQTVEGIWKFENKDTHAQLPVTFSGRRGLTIVVVKSSSWVSAMVVRVPSSGVSKFCHSQAGMCVRSRVWPIGVIFNVFGRTSAWLPHTYIFET